MISKEFQEIVKEYFDVFNDDNTRKCIIALEDSDQSRVLSSLSSSLYDKIIKEIDRIDFGDIPKSRGDITKVTNYDELVECINIINELVSEYGQDPTFANEVSMAIENVKANKVIFMKAFERNIELPKVLYNLIVLSIYQSLSFLIAVCIEYVKDSVHGDIQISIDKVSYSNVKNNVIYNQLVSFNRAVENREFDDAMRAIVSVREDTVIYKVIDTKEVPCNNIPSNDYEDQSPFDEPEEEEIEPKDVPDPNADAIHDNDDEEDYSYELDDQDEVVPVQTAINGSAEINESFTSVLGAIITAGSLSVKAIIFLLKVILVLIRNIVFFFINTRVKLSTMLEIQSKLIEYNAYKLQMRDSYDSLTDAERKKVVDKQMKIANKLKSMSNKIAIDNKQANIKATAAIDKDEKEKKVTMQDLEVPEDIANKSMLF